MSSSQNLKIPLQEILLATNGFAEENKIGTGGYGPVYRGQSEQHGMLAVKRLNRMHGQGDHEYGMEVTLLSKYKHENLVSLIGFCGEDGEKILVYKHEANGSLDMFFVIGKIYHGCVVFRSAWGLHVG
jgi:serine/threonine protein kinase